MVRLAKGAASAENFDPKVFAINKVVTWNVAPVYTAVLDAVVLENVFGDAGISRGRITQISVITDNNVVTNGQFRLIIYTDPTLGGWITDDTFGFQSWAPEKLVGEVDITLTRPTTNADFAWAVASVNLPLNFATADKDLYITLVTGAANYSMAADQFWDFMIGFETAPAVTY